MEDISDDELIALIKSGDTHAEAVFYDKYWRFAKNFGVKLAKLYEGLGFSKDDFINVSFSATFVALQHYEVGHHSFYKYWAITAKNECIKFMNENVSTNSPQGKIVSLDSTYYEDGMSLHETLGYNDLNISSELLANDIKEFITSNESQFSKSERLMAYYTIFEDYSVEQIVKLTNWTTAKVYREIRKMKNKVSNFIKSGYFDK